MMKKYLVYWVLSLFVFAGCGEDKGVEKDGEDELPPGKIRLELSVEDLVFEAEGGVKTFGVTCNGEWRIEGGGEWCTVEPDAGKGDRTVSVTVATYDGLEDRDVNLTVKAGDKAVVLGVTQKRKDAVVLSKDKLDVPQDGGTLSVQVQSNIDYEVTIPEEFRSWISQVPDSKAVEIRTYRFTIAGNEEPESRRGYIVFAAAAMKDTVYVYQSQKDQLLLDQDRYEVPAEGGTVTVELKTNVDYEVTIPEDFKSWISRVSGTRSIVSKTYDFIVGKNSYLERRGYIVFSANSLIDSVYIVQEGRKASIGDGNIYGDAYTESVFGFSFDMIYVQGGTFMMGATAEQGSDAYGYEKPVHQVTLSDYYISKYEVTQGLWEKVMGTTLEEQRDKAYKDWPLYGQGSDYPMYYVNWEEAQAFVEKLSELTGRHYVLPTEAQWEYAARGGVKSQGYKYSGSNELDDVAWHDDNSEYFTHPVGTKAANELGIYDMSGNVWEWCSDWYGDYSDESQIDPVGPVSGSFRVYRGGSWYSIARVCRVSYRGSSNPGSRDSHLGFRVALLP